jgi:hypothetical protein
MAKFIRRRSPTKVCQPYNQIMGRRRVSHLHARTIVRAQMRPERHRHCKAHRQRAKRLPFHRTAPPFKVLTRSNAQTPRNPHPSAWDPTSFSMPEVRARATMTMNQHRATIHPVVNATLINVATQKTLRKATTIHHPHQTQTTLTLNDGYHLNGRGQGKTTETSSYVSAAFSFK